MYTISAKNLNDAFLQLSKLMLAEGKPVTSRGMATLELHPVFLEIRNPAQRFMSLIGRKNNPMQTIYETLWVLSGRSDIGALSYYMPRAGDFSDDGKVWRGGYGPRLFRWNEQPDVAWGGINQMQGVIDTFKKDRATRQAVIQIWDPDQDGPEDESKDKPCTNYLHFMARDGKLDLMVVMRSNDLLWGFSSINVFEWTFLQELLANILYFEVGKYYHVVDSLHIYLNHVGRLVDIINTPQFDIYLDARVKPTRIIHRDLELFCNDIKIFTSYIDRVNKGEKEGSRKFDLIVGGDPWLHSAYIALLIFKDIKENKIDIAIDRLPSMVAEDMFVVTMEYLSRHATIHNDSDIAKRFHDLLKGWFKTQDSVAGEFILSGIT